MREEVAELLANKKDLLTITYFKLQKLFEKKYGVNTIVLMEIGTFFEVYEVNNDEEKIGKAKEIAELLNIQLTRKNKAILENSKENPIMAGVPAISLEKHLARIIAEQKYTVVLIKQKGIPPNVTRYLDTVVSPGTNFDFVLDQDENNITSLLIDQIRGIYLVGYSAIDVTTGKCYYNEVHGTSEDKFFALDEVFNYMNMHKTNEIIVSFADKNINQKEVIDYLELSLKTFHIGHFRPKISYQNELFKNVFNIESLLTSIEHLDMERVPLSTESLAVLIDFVIGHDSNIIQKLFDVLMDLSLKDFNRGCPLANMVQEMSNLDSDFDAMSKMFYQNLRAVMKAILDKAIELKELKQCDSSKLALYITVVVEGGILASKATGDADDYLQSIECLKEHLDSYKL